MNPTAGQLTTAAALAFKLDARPGMIEPALIDIVTGQYDAGALLPSASGRVPVVKGSRAEIE